MRKVSVHFMFTSQIVVCGGGPTGFAAAIAAARSGKTVTMLAPPASLPPGRTAALLDGSVRFLKSLDVWNAERFEQAPLRGIRLIDDTGSLFRAPEITFHASEIGLNAFGYNVRNSAIVSELLETAKTISEIEIIEEAASAISFDDKAVKVLTIGGRELMADLVVAADGARSIVRAASNIGERTWEYPQSALITTLKVERQHAGISTEFHTATGPFTLVPLGPGRMSLVWMSEPERAEALASINEREFEAIVERQAQSIHGKMSADTERVVIPMRGLIAKRFAGHRAMIVGEAAHVFPPIGAQGLNLGLRDVATFSRVIRRFGDAGSQAATDAYHAGRQADIQSRTYAVDLVNRSLLSSLFPVHLLRSGGLSVASAIPLLRKAIMRGGLARTLT